MSDEELTESIARNYAASTFLFEASLAGRNSPLGAIAFTAMTGFANAVDKMKDEQHRRKREINGNP